MPYLHICGLSFAYIFCLSIVYDEWILHALLPAWIVGYIRFILTAWLVYAQPSKSMPHD